MTIIFGELMFDQIKGKYIIRINGERVEPADATISIFDHGFLFGDSIYEVVQTVDGAPFGWDEHLSRLRNSANRLSMDLPWSDEYLRNEIDTALAAKTWDGESYVRFIITRGVGKIALLPNTCENPTLIIVAKAIPLPGPKTETGLVLCLTKVKRNSRHAMDPGIKSGNYLNNILAAIEAQNSGADDAVMLNENDLVTECTTSNIFIVKDSVVKTPSLDSGILDGITRQNVINSGMKAGINIDQTHLTIYDLTSADEIFMSGTIKGVVPVCEIRGEISWQGQPGPLTLKLQRAYKLKSGTV